MAENATIGALRVVLGLDTAKFEEGVKSATNTMGGFAKQMAAVAGGIQLQKAVEGLAKSFISLATGAIKTGDELFKASQRLGVPVEKLSVLTYAADLADVSFEQLSKSFVILAKNMNAAATGQITPATAALQALGFNLQEFGKLAPEEAFKRIADQFASMQDGATKTAIAVALFGRAGAQMIPLLNQGAAGFSQMTAEAQTFGQVMSTQAAKAAEGFNDNMKRLGSIVGGVAIQVTSIFLPALEKISAQMVEWAKDNEIVRRATEGLTRAIQFVIDNIRVLGTALAILVGAQLVSAIVSISTSFLGLARAIAAAGIAAVALNAAKTLTIAKVAAFGAIILWATGNLPAFVEGLEKIGAAIRNMLPEDAGGAIVKTLGNLGLNVDALTKDFKSLTDTGKDTAQALSGLKPPPAFSTEALQQGKKFNEEIRKLQLSTRELRGDFDQFAPGFVRMAQSLGLVNEAGTNLGTTVGSLTAQQRALNAEMMKNEAAKAAQDALLPWEQHSKQIEKYNLLMQQGGLSAEKAGILIRRSAESSGVAWDIASSKIAGDLAAGLGEFAKQNKKFAVAAKAAAIAQATINTYTAATKALATFPPPLSYIAAAAAVVAGLGYVSKITSQEAFATGGSFRVAGGLTGVDSQMVAFSATPGEIVDVRRPGQGSGPGGVQTIELRTPRVKDFFTENVRALVDTINAAAPDGYIIRMPAT
jgi:hypothetical protein